MLPKPYYENDLGRLYHGDCLDILPHLELVDLVLTDPPYNFEACGGGFYGVKWHGLTSEPREYLNKLKDIDCVDFNPESLLNILPVKYAYFFCNKTLITKYLSYAEKNGLLYDLLVMHKSNPIPAKNNHYLHDLEYVVLMRPKSSFFYCEEYYLMSKLYSTIVGNGKLHPAEKPLGIFHKFIKVSCPEKGIVIDPFLGSGTTAVACERLKRRWIGIEISEEYCAIAVKRIEAERKQLKLF